MEQLNIRFRHCNTVEEMLPNLSILMHMYEALTEEVYTNMLPDMAAKSYRQIVVEVETGTGNWTEAGMVAYWIIPRLWVNGNTLDLDNFVITPEYRSAGIGSEVLASVEQLARQEGCRLVVLDAYVSNHKAAKFYTRHNYIQKGFHYVKEV